MAAITIENVPPNVSQEELMLLLKEYEPTKAVISANSCVVNIFFRKEINARNALKINNMEIQQKKLTAYWANEYLQKTAQYSTSESVGNLNCSEKLLTEKPTEINESSYTRTKKNIEAIFIPRLIKSENITTAKGHEISVIPNSTPLPIQRKNKKNCNYYYHHNHFRIKEKNH